MRQQIVWSVLRDDVPWYWCKSKKEAEVLAKRLGNGNTAKWAVTETRIRKRAKP